MMAHQAPLTGNLTTAQRDFLTSQIPGLVNSANAMTSHVASNGRIMRQVDQALTRHEESETYIKSFIGHIEDVDLAEAVSRLNMNQIPVPGDGTGGVTTLPDFPAGLHLEV